MGITVLHKPSNPPLYAVSMGLGHKVMHHQGYPV